LADASTNPSRSPGRTTFSRRRDIDARFFLHFFGLTRGGLHILFFLLISIQSRHKTFFSSPVTIQVSSLFPTICFARSSLSPLAPFFLTPFPASLRVHPFQVNAYPPRGPFGSSDHPQFHFVPFAATWPAIFLLDKEFLSPSSFGPSHWSRVFFFPLNLCGVSLSYGTPLHFIQALIHSLPLLPWPQTIPLTSL